MRRSPVFASNGVFVAVGLGNSARMKVLTEETALARLAQAVGIATSYEDVFGRTHAASDATLTALLSAMGFDATTQERIARSHERLVREAIERGIEPVCVFSRGGRIDVPIVVRHERGTTLRWKLVAEDASIREGSADLSSTPCEAVADDAYRRYTLAVATSLDEGYYEFEATDGKAPYRSRFIVAPAACYVPEVMERRRVWGIAAHVYSLRSQRTTIAGDFSDLATFCASVRALGGSTVAVNPLHLLPRGASSPYGPSSRTYVNWTYLDITLLPGYDAAQAVRATPEKDLVDYEALYRERFAGARRAFERFHHAGQPQAFAEYLRDAGTPLRLAAVFEALAETYRTVHGADDWRTWPPEFHDPHGSAVEAFAREHAEDVAFYTYLQWQCDVQLARVASACGDMPIGLYRDLAVGTQLGGVDTWLGDGALVHAAAVGAPPDLINTSGQDWSVAPFDPLALRKNGYRAFADLLRANARHAGALRIDHVMGLLRLWWVPSGFSAADGAYVTYPLEEMLAVLALESHRAQFLVVGEDLGTVPLGFRERMEKARILSYRVLQFEHDDDGFVEPAAYPRYALASTGTHDLPTMPGYWAETDIDLREAAASDDRSDFSVARNERRDRRAALSRAFEKAAVAFGDGADVSRAAYDFLAQTPSLLLMLTLEDVLGLTDQLNVPASTIYPNWRRRSPVLLEAFDRDERFLAFAQALREAGRA